MRRAATGVARRALAVVLIGCAFSAGAAAIFDRDSFTHGARFVLLIVGLLFIVLGGLGGMTDDQDAGLWQMPWSSSARDVNDLPDANPNVYLATGGAVLAAIAVALLAWT